MSSEQSGQAPACEAAMQSKGHLPTSKEEARTREIHTRPRSHRQGRALPFGQREGNCSIQTKSSLQQTETHQSSVLNRHSVPTTEPLVEDTL